MWRIPEAPANEAARLAALTACGIMDTPREERFDRLTWLAQHIYDADVAFMGFVDGAHQWMKSVTSEAIAPVAERPKTVCQSVVSSGEPLVVGDLHSDERFAGHPALPYLTLHFYAGVPIKLAPDLVVGTLCIMREEAGDASGFDIAPLEALAAIAIDELELRTLNSELSRLSRLDPLTGLANRRAFDEELLRAGARCQRTGEPLSLLLLDLDRFKALNDTLGHQAGDEALRGFGRVLRAAARRDDTGCRYGGEEFALILAGADAEGAVAVGERIREELAECGLSHPQTGQLTTSIGVATAQGPAIDINALIADADAALYEAKRGGRDRVVPAAQAVALRAARQRLPDGAG
ncbi:sensor domain-containing diguanylate cyclase [Starkeya koreensis]|uniref:diguanylate cyclase n=1 Tax=Ancylobacter koreensis TaxID=266121 RepID=A0ABT0DPP4_9HYPH|nr:sensor domain-containing diguanylate cyclase [Ancylobacter koreensis]MCK0209238.1 sensor domain-containing diguanylate cyclase [Ancylobacter koreensis]